MEIRYSKQALKFLQKQEKKIQIRIISSIESIPLGNIKKLQGTDKYRLRVGDFRIIFSKDGHVLMIEKIDNRGQAYNRR